MKILIVILSLLNGLLACWHLKDKEYPKAALHFFLAFWLLLS